MTNAEIILNAQRQLEKAGKISADEEIHTYNAWKKLGFHVLRGEKAICMLKIWKPVTKKGRKAEPEGDEERQEENPWMMLKNAYFFSRSQVDSIA